MTGKKVFFDSNILIHMFSQDEFKAETAESLATNGGFISVQILNEVTQVLRKKLKLSWPEIDEIIAVFCQLFKVEVLTLDCHQLGRKLAQRYQLQFYDAVALATALEADCDLFMSEDMNHGLLVDGRLCI